LNRCPGAEDRVSLGQQSVAIDLRRSSKDRVVETMADMASLAKGQEPARLNRYVDVDRMDPVAKGRNELIEPLVQRDCAFRLGSANFFDGGFDLDDRGHRKENGILMSRDPASKAGPFWPARRQALLNRAVSINQVFTRFFLLLSLSG
jgi:hypothetical protein